MVISESKVRHLNYLPTAMVKCNCAHSTLLYHYNDIVRLYHHNDSLSSKSDCFL